MLKLLYFLIKTTFQTTIEILFPEFCVGCGKKNTLLCCNCYEEIEFSSFPFDHLNQLKYLDNVIMVCKYHEVIKKLVYEFKYKRVINVGKTIARLIYRSANLPACNLLVPIPIHTKKLKSRGFNQSEVISRELSKLTKTPTANLLVKAVNTKSQMSISDKEKRKNNLKNSFAINESILKPNTANKNKKTLEKTMVPKTVILVDDVVTTGSTLDECAKVLKKYGVKKVVGLVLAQR